MVSADDLTLDEIKAQLALYQVLYVRKRKETDPEYAEKLRERDRLRHEKKRRAEGKKPRVPANKKYDMDNLMLITPKN